MSEKNLFILQLFVPDVNAEFGYMKCVQENAFRLYNESVSTNKYTAFNDLNKLKVNKWKHNSK